MHIYVQKLSTLTIFAFFIFLAFTVFLYATRNHKILSKTISVILLIVAIYGILSYTVLGRTPSDEHTLVFASSIETEFYRELFMNALLYYPFGLSLTVLIGPWTILITLIISMLIESWQYFTGSGLAQGTDVIMNTIGAAIGALPYLIVKLVVKRKTARGRIGERQERAKRSKLKQKKQK